MRKDAQGDGRLVKVAVKVENKETLKVKHEGGVVVKGAGCGLLSVAISSG